MNIRGCTAAAAAVQEKLGCAAGAAAYLVVAVAAVAADGHDSLPAYFAAVATSLLRTEPPHAHCTTETQ